MKSNTTVLFAAVLLTTGMGVGQVSAAGLLGGGDSGGGGGVLGDTLNDVGDTVDNLLGGDNDNNGDSFGSIADVDSGAAGNDALANFGLGGGNDNIADVNVGRGSDPLANVNVKGGNGQGGLLNNGGLLGTGLLGGGNFGSNLTAGINLGGLGLDLSVPGLGDILGGDGGNGGGGNGGGGNGGNGNGGNGGNGANGANGRVHVGSVGGANPAAVNCSVNEGRQVLQLASQAKVNVRSWGNAANVQVVPVRLCPQARSQVAQIFRASGKINQLQSAAAGDALISASLSRTRYDLNDIFAVQATNGRLMVYVY